MKKGELLFGIAQNDLYKTGYLTHYKDENGKRVKDKAMSIWYQMILRCYDKEFKSKYPAYKDAYVCKEWLLFSNFKKWFDENYKLGFELDKDLKVLGNMCYSPKTCTFIPQILNTFSVGSKKKGRYLKGAYKTKHNKFHSRGNNPFTNEVVYLGSFDNELDAHKAWLSHKLKCVDELEKVWSSSVDQQLFTNLKLIYTLEN